MIINNSENSNSVSENSQSDSDIFDEKIDETTRKLPVFDILVQQQHNLKQKLLNKLN